MHEYDEQETRAGKTEDRDAKVSVAGINSLASDSSKLVTNEDGLVAFIALTG